MSIESMLLYPERFELWCGFDYTGYDQPGFGPQAISALERCHQAGARGVGELHDKGKGLVSDTVNAFGMHPDDARMDPLFERCGAIGHAGEYSRCGSHLDVRTDGQHERRTDECLPLATGQSAGHRGAFRND